MVLKSCFKSLYWSFVMKRFSIALILVLSLFGGETNESEGAKIYTKHGCYGCHGIDAEGIAPYPKLAGKSAYYIRKRLQDYKKGTIHSGHADIMRPFAQSLSDQEIDILADYLEHLGQKKRSNEERYYQEYEVGDSSGS